MNAVLIRDFQLAHIHERTCRYDCNLTSKNSLQTHVYIIRKKNKEISVKVHHIRRSNIPLTCTAVATAAAAV